jgi:hypothetical protein
MESIALFQSMQRIKKSISHLITYDFLRSDIEWFKENEEKIMESVRGRFYESIKLMVCLYYYENIK